MVTFLITPQRREYPSLAVYDVDSNLTYDLRNRRNAISDLSKQLTYINWQIRESIRLQVIESFLKRADVQKLLMARGIPCACELPRYGGIDERSSDFSEYPIYAVS